MTALSETILEKYQVRKTKKQKTEFIEFMKTQIPGLQVEEGGFPKNRNLVAGDVKSAQVILTAHYDTCAQLPFPNFITPQNFLIYLLYNLLIVIPFLVIFLISYVALRILTENGLASLLLSYIIFMFSMFYTMMGGRPNPRTANDNTSGVITLCEIWAAMTEAERSKTAIVFFDNEENGLLGSSYFRKCHNKEALKEKLVINFDCVSDGDHMLFVQNKPARKQYGQALEAAFPSTAEKTAHYASSSNTFYPSDQSNFPTNIGVASMNKKPILGLYMGRIHTKRDIVFDTVNIGYLTSGTKRFLETVLK